MSYYVFGSELCDLCAHSYVLALMSENYVLRQKKYYDVILCAQSNMISMYNIWVIIIMTYLWIVNESMNYTKVVMKDHQYPTAQL